MLIAPRAILLGLGLIAVAGIDLPTFAMAAALVAQLVIPAVKLHGRGHGRRWWLRDWPRAHPA